MAEAKSVGGTISILETATIRVKGEHDVLKKDKCSLAAVQWVQRGLGILEDVKLFI